MSYGDDSGLDQVVDDMVRAAESGFSEEIPVGQKMLDGLVVLSAAVSALFFLLYGRAVFRDLWSILAILMTLLVGLMPTEYAYVSWRNIRKNKQKMTSPQLTFSALGIAFAVGFAVFSTIAMFIAGFPEVPEEIRRYSGWFVFIALTFPLPIQFMLVAAFELYDQQVVENHTRARAHAIRFAALQRFGLAKLGAALIGMKRQLARELKEYGTDVGGRGAARLLGREGYAPSLSDASDAELDEAELAKLLDAERPAQERVSFFGRFRRRPKAEKPTAIEGQAEPTHDAPRQNETPAPAVASAASGLGAMSDEDLKRLFRLMAEISRESGVVPTPSPNGQEANPSHPH